MMLRRRPMENSVVFTSALVPSTVPSSLAMDAASS